jgi:hypothetical protein
LITPDALALQQSLVLDLGLGILDHAGLSKPSGQLPGEELVAGESLEPQDFVLKDTVEEDAERRQHLDS